MSVFMPNSGKIVMAIKVNSGDASALFIDDFAIWLGQRLAGKQLHCCEAIEAELRVALFIYPQVAAVHPQAVRLWERAYFATWVDNLLQLV